MIEYRTFSRQESHVAIAVYGESGSGKTRLCSTAPGFLFVSSEEKFSSVRQDRFSYIHVDAMGELIALFDKIIADPAVIQGCQTLCVDSLTDIAEKTLRDKPSGTGNKMADYLEIQTLCVDFFNRLPLMPYDVVVVFKLKSQRVDSYNVKFYPSLPGKDFSTQVPYYFDFIFATRSQRNPEKANEVSYFIQTRSDDQYVAKDCSDHLETFAAPDLDAAIKLIKAPWDFGASTQTQGSDEVPF